jgi:SAM-dependent methyltransferase
MPSSIIESLWQKQARQWSRIGSPLRPCAEDVANFKKALADDPMRCLLLGVTPELAQLSPSLTAVDNSEAMIQALWKNESSAIHGDWLDLPFQEDTFDTVIGDGCLTLLTYPMQYEKLFSQLHHVLSHKGKVAIRLFVSPDESESPELVCHEASSGKIKSFHAFKWRLSMALASMNEDHNVAVSDTWMTFDRLLPDRVLLATKSGWSMLDIETIDVYRHSDAVYSHPTLTKVRDSASISFNEKALLFGSYELAERCPILVLESRK